MEIRNDHFESSGEELLGRLNKILKMEKRCAGFAFASFWFSAMLYFHIIDSPSEWVFWLLSVIALLGTMMGSRKRVKLQEGEYILSAEGIRCEGVDARISPWNSFDRQGETGHYIYLVRKDRKVFLIDTDRMSCEDHEKLRTLIQNVKVDRNIENETGALWYHIVLGATLILVAAILIYLAVEAFYPLQEGYVFRKWFTGTMPAILFSILLCLDLLWIITACKLLKFLPKKIVIGICGIGAGIILGCGILIVEVRTDTETEHSNGTITVAHTVWLDRTRYYLYKKENFLVMKFLRPIDSRMEERPKTDPEPQEIHREEQKTEGWIDEGYQKIYQTFLKESSPEYRKAYDAKGNSYVVVFEDEASIRFLVYDREKEDKRSLRYVYYQSNKNEDGSWSSMDAEILDMYQYDHRSQKVVDLKKTTW